MTEKRISRRRWLEITGGTIVGLVVGAAAGYSAMPVAPAKTITQTVAGPTVTQTVTLTPVVTPTPPPMLRKAAMVCTGSKGDKAWVDVHYMGLEALKKKYGTEIAYTDMAKPVDWEKLIRDYAAAGYNFILPAGVEFTDVTLKVAKDYPGTYFMVTLGYAYADNVMAMDIRQHEFGFLGGALAGLMTKTKKVGAISGVDYPTVVRMSEAYKLGAKYVNPDVETIDAYIGSWTDVEKAKETAIAMIDAGVDVIMMHSSFANFGIIEAAKARRVWVIGEYIDQNVLLPDLMITSLLMDVPWLVLKAAEMIETGTWVGARYSYGLKDGVASLAPYHGLVPDPIAKRAEEIKKDIIRDKIRVPEITKPTG